MLPAPNLDDRRLPGSRRRRQATGAAALPDVDRPQRVRSGRDPDRGVRADGRPADLPAEPGPRPALHQVPRADRGRAAAAGGGQGRGDLLAVRAAAADRAGPQRDPGGHAAHRRQRPGRLHHDPRAGDRAVRLRPRRVAPVGRLAGRQHRGSRRRRLPLLLLAHRLPATRCWSGCPTRCRAARCCSGWTAGCRVAGSIRAGRRWSGRPGPVRAGRPARSARTRPAD